MSAKRAILMARGGAMPKRTHAACDWAAMQVADDWSTWLDRLPPIERRLRGPDPAHVGPLRLVGLAGRSMLVRRIEDRFGQPALLAAVLDPAWVQARARDSAAAVHPQITLAELAHDSPPVDPAALTTDPDGSTIRCPSLGLQWDLPPAALADLSGDDGPLRWLVWFASALALVALALAGWAQHRARRQLAREQAFVAAASHELRTPVAAVRALSENLASGIVTDDARRARYLASIDGESRRLAGLVDNLLDQARLERGALRVETQPGVVLPVAQRVGERLPPDAVVLDASCDAARADPEALERMLGNLLDNAAKYAADASVTLTGKRVGKQVELTVADRGPGLPARERRRVLKAWQRAPGHDHRPGLGLGLHLVAALARAHGGELRLADHKPGLAATIVLPVAHAP